MLQMLQALLRSNDAEDKVLALKAIGNVGAIELITELGAFINEKSNSYIVRSQAMFAMRKMAKAAPGAVRIRIEIVLASSE